jgi:hypothetical protein
MCRVVRKGVGTKTEPVFLNSKQYRQSFVNLSWYSEAEKKLFFLPFNFRGGSVDNICPDEKGSCEKGPVLKLIFFSSNLN